MTSHACSRSKDRRRTLGVRPPGAPRAIGIADAPDLRRRSRRAAAFGIALVAFALAAAPPSAAAQDTPQDPPVERDAPGAPPAEPSAPAQPETAPPDDATDAGAPQVEVEQRRRRGGRPVFRLGGDIEVNEGAVVAEAVVISGTATIAGEVERDLAVILGNARLASTAVVGGDLVIVGGSLVVEPGAAVARDLVIVGGTLDAPADFAPGGEQVVVGTTTLGRHLEGLVPWVAGGLLWGRLIVPSIGWMWWVVGFFFLANLAIAVVFEQPVRSCADVLARKPLTTFLIGLLALLLAGPLFLLLTVSVVGIVVVPFAVCALVLAWIVGKVGVARWIGMSVVPEGDGEGPLSARRSAGVRSFALGFAIICIAYMIPVLGLIAWATIGVLGTGAAVAAVVAGYRRENPPSPRPVVQEPVVPPMAPSAAAPTFGTSPPAPAAPSFPPEPAPVPPPVTPPTPPPAAAAAHDWPRTGAAAASPSEAPSVPPAWSGTFPYASFRDRLAAFVLDLFLVAVAAGLLDIDGPRRVLTLLLVYHVAFWTWKATTVGGIICQLRVVRITGEPLRFADALVRGLSSILSLAGLGLGALWILKDPERQAWHDKIAGTYVVKVPRHYPV